MLRFNTIAFAPVADSKAAGMKNKLIEEVVFEGRKLIRNPRCILKNDQPTATVQDRVVWEMKVVKSEGEGKPPEEIHFRVMETTNEVANWPATAVVLAVKFGGQKRQLQLIKGASERVYTLMIPTRINQGCLPRLANQVVADLIVNGRAQPYLNGGNGKKRSRGISHRDRYRREKHARYPI